MAARLKWTKVAPRDWRARAYRWSYELASEGTSSTPLYRWRAIYTPPSGAPVVLEGDARTLGRATAEVAAQTQASLF